MEGRALHIFPCRADKRPTSPHGYKDAVADLAGIARLWSLHPGQIIGVATGVISGIDVLDIDTRRGGDQWFHQHRDHLPITRTHETRNGGLHLIFRHTPGLPNTTDRIAPGVETISDGRHVIWWPSHGYRVLCEGPVAEFPRWLLDEVVTRVIKRSASGPNGARVHPFTSGHLQSTRSVVLRSKYLLQSLERTIEGNRHKMLYWTACRFGNMIGEGKMKVEVAEHLLIEAAKANHVWNDDPGNCLATIRDGLREGKDQWAQSKRVDPAPDFVDGPDFIDEGAG